MSVVDEGFILHPSVAVRWGQRWHDHYPAASRLHEIIVERGLWFVVTNLFHHRVFNDIATELSTFSSFGVRQFVEQVEHGLRQLMGTLDALTQPTSDETYGQMIQTGVPLIPAALIAARTDLSLDDAAMALLAVVEEIPIIVSDERVFDLLSAIAILYPQLKVHWLRDVDLG